MIIFHYDALPVNPAFAAGLLSTPPAAVASLNPRRKVVDGPTDADRIAWYFRDEIAAFNAMIETAAEEDAATLANVAGYFHG